MIDNVIYLELNHLKINKKGPKMLKLCSTLYGLCSLYIQRQNIVPSNCMSNVICGGVRSNHFSFPAATIFHHHQLMLESGRRTGVIFCYCGAKFVHCPAVQLGCTIYGLTDSAV